MPGAPQERPATLELDENVNIAVALAASASTNQVSGAMARLPNDLLHGTLDVLVLRTLLPAPMHGYGLTRAIEARTDGVLNIEDAALYKALHRLQRIGAVDSEWGVSDNNRRARYYRLTVRGRRELRAETETWRRFAAAIVAVLGPA